MIEAGIKSEGSDAGFRMMPQSIHISQDILVSAGIGVSGKGMAFESPFPAPAMERPILRRRLLSVAATFLADRFPVEVDTKCVVDQAIEDAVGNGRVADLLVQVRDRHL